MRISGGKCKQRGERRSHCAAIVAPVPMHQQTFTNAQPPMQARYILLNGGNLQVGTQAIPYPGKATITLWGHPQDRELPGYGSKCLAVRAGNLTLHGRHRTPTWTQLRTGNPLTVGATSLVVAAAVNWRAGDTIIVTSSSIYAEDVDTLTIASVAVDAAAETSLITTLEAAQFHHLAVVLDAHKGIGGLEVDMRAEVAVLSRDVVVEGDADSVRYMFGAVMMLHAPPVPGAARSNFWLEQVEVRQAGQAFRLGRYPVHLHMNGALPETYMKGCAIHHTYNRAMTMHGTNNTLVANNVAFDTMGHQFFIEDGSEEQNTYDGNLAVLARQSHALLVTDTTPANFWLTNPNNTVINNVAGGSTAGYGFWYRCVSDPTRPCNYTCSAL
jgi:hypothetical protein